MIDLLLKLFYELYFVSFSKVYTWSTGSILVISSSQFNYSKEHAISTDCILMVQINAVHVVLNEIPKPFLWLNAAPFRVYPHYAWVQYSKCDLITSEYQDITTLKFRQLNDGWMKLGVFLHCNAHLWWWRRAFVHQNSDVIRRRHP